MEIKKNLKYLNPVYNFKQIIYYNARSLRSSNFREGAKNFGRAALYAVPFSAELAVYQTVFLGVLYALDLLK